MMHCYICVTYMIILTSANPVPNQEIAAKHEKRSLFHDVIESLRIRAQLPEEINQNEDNVISHNYERYGFEREPQLPSDLDFIPRRNDRIDIPRLKYRFPKNLELNTTENSTLKEVVIYVDSDKHKTTTQKPKKRPQQNKNKPNRNKESDGAEPDDNTPITNTMAGQSQIGNRESQTVVKPTVIVNIRGTVSHRDSDIKLERKTNDTYDLPRNVFNINQEINIDRDPERKETKNKIKQNVRVVAPNEKAKVDEDMMMCETNYKADNNVEANRKFDNVLQILFTV